MRRRTAAGLVDALTAAATDGAEGASGAVAPGEGGDGDAGDLGWRAVEVGVGRRPDVAAGVAAQGFDVVATDVRERAVPEAVAFVVDDVTDPDRSIYADAALVYGLNLPAELQRPTVRVAREVGAACRFTTLGAEQPTVAATPTTLPGETLYAPTAPGGEGPDRDADPESERA